MLFTLRHLKLRFYCCCDHTDVRQVQGQTSYRGGSLASKMKSMLDRRESSLIGACTVLVSVRLRLTPVSWFRINSALLLRQSVKESSRNWLHVVGIDIGFRTQPWGTPVF